MHTDVECNDAQKSVHALLLSDGDKTPSEIATALGMTLAQVELDILDFLKWKGMVVVVGFKNVGPSGTEFIWKAVYAG